MIVHLRAQRPLDNPGRQLPDQPARPVQQLDACVLRVGDHPVDRRVADEIRQPFRRGFLGGEHHFLQALTRHALGDDCLHLFGLFGAHSECPLRQCNSRHTGITCTLSHRRLNRLRSGCPLVPAALAAGAITAAVALAVGLTEQPPVQSAITAVLLCLLLAVTGQFIRRGRQSQDRTELLLAQLQDEREAEAAAAALAERSRIAGELHDVLAHSLSGLAIQLQGARKLAGREAVSESLRATIDRSAELTKAGLADARQAVSALRGEQLPTLAQLGALVEDFRRDTGTDATLRIDGTSLPLPAEASLALFRGAQEALTNITRYAPGATTAVTVSYQPDRTLVTIEDHVCPAGADPGNAPAAQPGLLADAGGGHGLTAMRERARRAGGTARAGPTAGGWLVELEVPG